MYGTIVNTANEVCLINQISNIYTGTTNDYIERPVHTLKLISHLKPEITLFSLTLCFDPRCGLEPGAADIINSLESTPTLFTLSQGDSK